MRWATTIDGLRPVDHVTPSGVVLLATEPDPPYNWLWLDEPELSRREGGPPPKAHVLPTVLVRSALVTPDLTLAIEHKYLCPEDPGEEIAITGGATE